ncbi:MAG: GWxTD domain-containing protein [candidate division WOR-3 bacterium]|nr:MAG: GWxTD domain-containing protein [candidate division WOR-3 bacterium]
MAFLIVMMLQQMDMNVYRFDRGYIEVWYQLPVAYLVDSQRLHATEDTVYDFYSYRFNIQNVDGTDSAILEGKKGVMSYGEDSGELILDYIPLSLYSGKFEYALQINARDSKAQGGGIINIPPDTIFFSCSDIVIGRFGYGDFVFHDLPFLPSIAAEFTDRERIFSYLEIYGLVPDSLFYEASYRILDEEGEVVLEQKRKVLKRDYVQIDTHSVALSQLVDGRYDYTVFIRDSSSQSSVTRIASFAIRTGGDEAGQEFYEQVQYFITPDEYLKFLGLSGNKRRVYLKEFWSRHDYGLLVRRIKQADERFSAGNMLGRDSERGRLYILLGAPDEIETIPIATWSRPFEVWYYYGRNDYLFCDVRNDHNPKLIRILKPGEIAQIIETGFRDGIREEDWLSDIAPGTHDWHRDFESIE